MGLHFTIPDMPNCIRHSEFSVSGMINMANSSDLNQSLTHTQLEKMTIISKGLSCPPFDNLQSLIFCTWHKRLLASDIFGIMLKLSNTWVLISYLMKFESVVVAIENGATFWQNVTKSWIHHSLSWLALRMQQTCKTEMVTLKIWIWDLRCLEMWLEFSHGVYATAETHQSQNQVLTL